MSLIGSLVGAALGIIGTSINYAFKNKDIQKLMEAVQQSSHREHREDFSGAKDANLREVFEEWSANFASEHKAERQTQSDLLATIDQRIKVHAVCCLVVTCLMVTTIVASLTRLG